MKNKKLKKEHNSLSQSQMIQQSIETPNIKGNVVIWVDKFGNSTIYEGFVDDIKCFEISRGILTFSMKITNKNIKNKKRNFTSVFIKNLQEIANKIIQGEF
jgi:hypothetical protein